MHSNLHYGVEVARIAKISQTNRLSTLFVDTKHAYLKQDRNVSLLICDIKQSSIAFVVKSIQEAQLLHRDGAIF